MVRGVRISVYRTAREGRAIIFLGAALAAWSAAVAAVSVGGVAAPFSGRGTDALLIAPPLLLALIWLLGRQPAGPLLRLATGWTAVLAAVLLLTPQVLSDPTLDIALPAVIALTWLVYRAPLIGVVAVLAITASFGSLSAYLSIPYKRALTLLLVALALAAIARLVIQRRRNALSLPFGLLLASAYVCISGVQVLLAADVHQALGGFALAPLYMATLFVIAYSQWSLQTQTRIVKCLAVIAVLVGGYATLRLIIGPSAAERSLAARSVYNFVNGSPKLIGSFPSGPDLAEWATLLIPFCLSCALGFKGRLRLIAAVALPLLAIGLFGSKVRAPALAVGLAVLFVAIMHARPRAFPYTRIGQTTLALIAVIAIGAGAYALGGGGTKQHSYLAVLTGDTQDVSVSVHKYKWGVAFRDLAGHPFGYGLGTAPAGYTSNTPPSSRILPVTGFSVDNGFLKIALEQGFTVMVVFALALVLLVIGLARGGLMFRDPARATIALGAAGTAMSLFVLEGAGAFADGVPAIAGWIVIGLGVAQLVERPSSSAD